MELLKRLSTAPFFGGSIDIETRTFCPRPFLNTKEKNQGTTRASVWDRRLHIKDPRKGGSLHVVNYDSYDTEESSGLSQLTQAPHARSVKGGSSDAASQPTG